MDILSHILIGKIISFNKTKVAQIWAMLFSFLPDLGQLPFYLVLGYENARPFLFPYNSDWMGARATHPFLTAMWDIPHSFIFLFLIILPVILFFKIPKIAFFAYGLHLLIDIPAHAGEWAIKLFYPLNFTMSGITDAWAWPIWGMALSWIILIIIIFALKFLKINGKSFNSN
ncbi:MAG: hypothetical protein A2402_02630 [Candidatus Staskawiczbacteria bacterium RIFOXYC1_FULL_37_43]|nr:MAG: hypothetical protein A2813_03595 [Candidatus Staskawiczbacteria bacterium RIFCSPHIGHO2_01_FULL_37_17]OGZ71174.1 MAG: hypothetical protein A2891_03935 [Candidatus Staskawiczbacteria bacterium RIFCSPLOWO2_01_FULL_37_19]OGZ76257.1 MAG: hypothetical protein A2205_00580 [Candidatus Staskawiczbacteria bacterium RIFOXYA1_FULL_37_15]OGZ77629.1 MAG: hypothetical protein A2280_03535 [Candidatus Staskawiczbacteria bacterium RIFOXYA12_FULL_37_10]OGZ80272.1 MAG: hypothetical protein A2353_03290 [Can